MAKQRKATQSRYRYFPTPDVNKLRFSHFHKRSATVVSKTYEDLNHTECMLIIHILQYSLMRGVKQAGLDPVLCTISNNYQYRSKLAVVWDALLRKGYLIELSAMPRNPMHKAYRLSRTGKHVIEIYLKAQEDLIKRYTPKYQKPITIKEYFEDYE